MGRGRPRNTTRLTFLPKSLLASILDTFGGTPERVTLPTSGCMELMHKANK